MSLQIHSMYLVGAELARSFGMLAGKGPSKLGPYGKVQ